jgi:hypothetical protein
MQQLPCFGESSIGSASAAFGSRSIEHRIGAERQSAEVFVDRPPQRLTHATEFMDAAANIAMLMIIGSNSLRPPLLRVAIEFEESFG